MRILVMGAGTMGRGIAEVCLLAGHQVFLTDANPPMLDRAQTLIRQHISREIERGRLPVDRQELVWAQFQRGDDWRHWSPDWVIEAVPEDADLKAAIFRELDDIFPESVWLASNTSSIAISRIQAAARRYPERVGGLHFFNPVPRMRLVEVILGIDTREEYGDKARELVNTLGKTAIKAPDRPGFLVNRIARPYYLEALRLVDQGVVDIEQCDRILEWAGFPLGPFRLMDLVGVDVNFAVTRSVYEATFHDERYRPHPLQESLVIRGHLGQKSGRGFYRYDRA